VPLAGLAKIIRDKGDRCPRFKNKPLLLREKSRGRVVN